MAGAAHRDACLAEVLGLGLYLESFQLPSTALLDTVADRSGLDHSELAITAVSGASALRRRHGKDFDDDALLRCVDALQARRISCSIFFALGLPGEDDAAFAATMTLARRLLERDRSGTLRVAALPQALDPGARMGLDPAAWGMVPTGPGDLSARIDRGQRLAAGTLHPLDPSAMGYTVPGCDTRARAALWNTLAAEHPRAVMPTLGG